MPYAGTYWEKQRAQTTSGATRGPTPRPPIVLHWLARVATCAIGLLTLACTHTTPPPDTGTTAPSSAAVVRALDALDALDLALERAKQGHLQAQLIEDPQTRSWLAQVEQAQQDVRWLRRQAPRWPSSQAFEALTTSVLAQATLLDERLLLRAAPPPLGLLDSVSRDIAIKAQQCRLFGGPMPVSVNVITKDHGNQEVSGYEVWFVRKGFEDAPREFRRFDRHSSPAARIFNDPGYYVLWLERQAASGERLKGERVDVEIGPEQRSQEIDLLAPTPQVMP
jgi:hypothetical protein